MKFEKEINKKKSHSQYSLLFQKDRTHPNKQFVCHSPQQNPSLGNILVTYYNDKLTKIYYSLNEAP